MSGFYAPKKALKNAYMYNQKAPQGVEYQHEFYIHESSYHYE